MLKKKEKKTESLGQILARYKIGNPRRRLVKKDLEIEIDGQKFYLEDIPFKSK